MEALKAGEIEGGDTIIIIDCMLVEVGGRGDIMESAASKVDVGGRGGKGPLSRYPSMRTICIAHTCSNQ